MSMQRTLTRDEVKNALGPVDDTVVAQIIASGATADELAEARAWLESNEPMVNAGRRLASGNVGGLVEILARIDEERYAEERQWR